MHRAKELTVAALSLLILCAVGNDARGEEPPATIEQRWYVQPPPNPTEPKRVRTITIRGDSDDTATTPDESAPVPEPGYFVQVASQRTRAEALSSYRALQVKYSPTLGGREPELRRVDLGDKAFFRAEIGPFATDDEADAFCLRLKTAGGQCTVQKN